MRTVAALPDSFLKIGPYHIEEEEFGVIPMTDYPFPFRTGKHILHTGTAGGLTKASTGYTFVNVMRMNRRIIEAISLLNQPIPVARRWHFRYGLYDSILLDVLCKNRYSGQDIFKLMFITAPISHGVVGERKPLPGLAEDVFHIPTTPFIQGFLNV
jgi:lycopene beta-cyclase